MVNKGKETMQYLDRKLEREKTKANVEGASSGMQPKSQEDFELNQLMDVVGAMQRGRHRDAHVGEEKIK